MSKLMNVLCTSLCALTLNTLQGDDIGLLPENEFPGSVSSFDAHPSLSSMPSQDSSLSDTASSHSFDSSSVAPSLATPQPLSSSPAAKKPRASFKSFTGKVKGKKVRMRMQPDLDSAIVRECSRGEMLLVVEDAGDFWAVEPPSDLKAFIFRSFVLDNVVEGNRVNVRLHPNLDSPVLTHLNCGDRVEGNICASNNKWMEVSLPSNVQFYVAKSYVENVGPPEIKSQYEFRTFSAKQQLEDAEYFAENEMKKNFPDIDFEKMSYNFQSIAQEYQDLPEYAERAKELLSHVQENYIDKRITYLETKQPLGEEAFVADNKSTEAEMSPTDKMKLWEPVEESLYLSWANINDNRSIDDYYSEQKIGSVHLTGILEPYFAPVKCKPGDFILRENELPIAYVYSTVVNLQNLVGKKVTVVGTSRPNNNFAFPAYFVIAVE